MRGTEPKQSPAVPSAPGRKLELIRNMMSLYRDLPFIRIRNSDQRDPERHARTVREEPGIQKREPAPKPTVESARPSRQTRQAGREGQPKRSPRWRERRRGATSVIVRTADRQR
jgi:hypothetical protein